MEFVRVDGKHESVAKPIFDHKPTLYGKAVCICMRQSSLSRGTWMSKFLQVNLCRDGDLMVAVSKRLKSINRGAEERIGEICNANEVAKQGWATRYNVRPRNV